MPPSVPTKINGLCRCCATFDIKTFSLDPHGECPMKLADMITGTKQGCEFCSLLHQEVEEALHEITRKGGDWSSWYLRLSLYGSEAASKKRNGFNKLRAFISPYHSLSVQEIRSGIPLRILEKQNKMMEAQFYLAAEPESAAARSGTIAGRYLGSDPASDRLFSVIKTWVDDCVTKHEACVQTASGKEKITPRRVPLPTRCIRVTKKHFYLYETGEVRGSYITLSHRWDAETGPSKTTISNYQDRLAGKFEMPQKFMDAIEVARGVGIEYVWIDSICIIQEGDELEDWKKEALKMATYYQNSIFTIAAVGTTTSGFLQKRQSAPFSRLARLPFRDDEGVRKGSLYAYRPTMDEREEFQYVHGSDLLSRGWVYQEWVLSRRIVYYTPTQVIMECQSRPPRTENNYIVEEKHGDTTISSTFKRSFELAENSSPISRWYFIVTAYSARELTSAETDRVVALSGIAQEFKNFLELRTDPTRLQYVSGLWLQDIYHGLLWLPAKQNPAVALSNAPSWSWTSFLGEVSWFRRNKNVRQDIEIMSIRTEDVETQLVDGVITHTPAQPNSAPQHGDPDPVVVAAPYSDLTNLHAILRIKGKVQSVLVGDELEDSERLDIESVLPLDSPKLGWKVLCSPRLNTVLAGCCSFERMKVSKGTSFQAFLISTEKGYFLDGSWVFGIGRIVCHVLLLQADGQGRHQRVGIGKVFDVGLIDGFRTAEETVVELT